METGGRKSGLPSSAGHAGVLGLGPCVWPAGCASPRGLEVRFGLPKAVVGPDCSQGQRVHVALRRGARGRDVSRAVAKAVPAKGCGVARGRLSVLFFFLSMFASSAAFWYLENISTIVDDLFLLTRESSLAVTLSDREVHCRLLNGVDSILSTDSETTVGCLQAVGAPRCTATVLRSAQRT